MPTIRPQDGRERLVVHALRITGVLELLYWVGFYAGPLAPTSPPPCFFEYERAFLLPDTVVACSLVAASVLRGRAPRLGRVVTSAAAGALVFLGLLDMSFNTMNGVYRSSLSDLIGNLGLNLYCVAFGLGLLVHDCRSNTSAAIAAPCGELT